MKNKKQLEIIFEEIKPDQNLDKKEVFKIINDKIKKNILVFNSK